MGTVLIPLTQGKFAAIDAEDAVRVSAHKWHAWKHPKTHLWYARHSFVTDGVYGQWRLHRFILDAAPDAIIDHADGDGLNCTRANLRGATNSQNGANHRLNENNTSGYTGVISVRNGQRWQAKIVVQRRPIYLGVFKTPEDAAHAYDRAAIEHFGAFARINFPGEPPPPAETIQPGLLSSAEAAAYLGVQRKLINSYVDRGKLPVAQRLQTGQTYYRTEDLDHAATSRRPWSRRGA